MIKLTVALPVYNSKHIVWLCMESLCRQQNIDFEWELIVCEENDVNSAGQEFFSSYMERLQKINCKLVKYIPLTAWIPLAQKWRKIGQSASKTSLVFVLQAADCYSHPLRLKRTFDSLHKKQFDWYQCTRGFFYHIFTNQLIIYDHQTFGPIHRRLTALNMATLTDHARRLPVADKKKGVDGWFLSTIRGARIFNDRNVAWKKGVDTQGLNNISKKRARFFQATTVPFVKTAAKITEVLPEDILSRLEDTKNKMLGFVEKEEEAEKEAKEKVVINWMNDIQENTELSFVYVWVKSAQVWNELAVSIKSLRKFYKGKYKIFVVGDNPELSSAIHIPAKLINGFAYCRSMDIANKLDIIINNQNITDNFVLMYDDIVLLKPVDYRTMKLVVAHDRVEDAQAYFKQGSGVNPSSRWQDLFRQTIWMLQKKGLPTYNYETHLPRLLNKDLLAKVMHRYHIRETPCLFNTLYYNTYFEKPDVELRTANRIKADGYRPYDNEIKLANELKSKTFLNYDNNGLNELMKRNILKILNS